MSLLAIDPATVQQWGAAAALVAGLTSSAHCALMCGPVACAASVRAEKAPALVQIHRRRAVNAQAWAPPVAYHLSRISAYGAVGAVLGLAGEGARHALAAVAPILPWVMAGALIATALGLGKRWRVPSGLRRLALPLARKSAKLAPAARAAAIGASTPLLPCASLYPLFVAAMAAATALGGALLMSLFALGATPALALVQVHAPLVGRHPRAAHWLRRVVPLVAAALLVWRALHAGDGSSVPTCH